MLRILTLLFALSLCTCDSAKVIDTARTQVPGEVDISKHEWPEGQKIRVILDSDTANETDDLFAIAYAVPDETIDLLGLSSAQWFHHRSGDSTVYQSQRLNEDLLGIMGRMDLPHPLGSDMIMGKPWGGYDARDSPGRPLHHRASEGYPGRRKTSRTQHRGRDEPSQRHRPGPLGQGKNRQLQPGLPLRFRRGLLE